MFRLGLLVGMRPGELAGLRWGDVDFDRGILTVGHAVQMRGSRGVHVDVLKTSASHRTIGLPAAAISELQKQLQRRAPDEKAAIEARAQGSCSRRGVEPCLSPATFAAS